MLLRILSFLFALLFTVVKGQIIAEPENDTSASKKYIINTISISGNKVTKDFIITREIPFAAGDTIDSKKLTKKLAHTQQNIMNTALFNFVDVEKKETEDDKIDIHIHVTERWYIWPVPIFEIEERNFNTWLDSKNLARATYGFDILHDNFLGRKQSLSIRLRSGYTHLYGIAYRIPYIDKKQRQGVGFSIGQSKNHEIAYATLNNGLLFYKDTENFVKKEFSARINYTYRHAIYNNHLLEARYYKGTLRDTLLSLGKDYPYYADNKNTMEFVSLDYIFRRDRRNYRYYPLKGYYFDFEAIKYGLGILKNEKLDVIQLYSSYKKYWQLSNRFYAAASIKGKVSGNSHQPYSVMRAFGYNTYVRGYEYYVIDGYNYALAKTGLTYEIIKPKTHKLPIIKLEQFSKFYYALYARIYADMGYVDNPVNFEFNKLNNMYLMGAGAAIDIVTYYDGVLRIEYSFNKLGEYGFFLHLTAPI